MKEIIKETIQRVYKNGDNLFYIDSCGKSDIFTNELHEIFNKYSVNQDLANYKNGGPSIEWSIDFTGYQIERKTMLLETVLYISKLCPVFYINHTFSLPNLLEKQTTRLSGYGNLAYIQEQYNLHLDLAAFLKSKEYIELDYEEFNEVVCDLRFPEEVTIFGKQVTVQYALFFDLLELVK